MRPTLFPRAFSCTLTAVLLFGLGAQAASPLKFGEALPANMFVELARVVNPAVVNISTKILPKFRGSPYGDRRNDPLFDMMQQLYGMQMVPQQPREQHALGTGFIIRDDGMIVTNNHVIAGADVIQVQLTENAEKLYDAKVIGSDERTDIALIKIEPKEKLPTVALGSSSDLEVGEWVAAFGNPFGNGHTMTKGIISAKGRALGEINKFPLIQTDAPINPGNSGGPLVNTKGLVVGVNSAIDARAQGIGFAIPIDEVKMIIPQLEKNGRIKKGYLGVALGELDENAAASLGLKDAKGAVIMQVQPGTPAANAGLKTYDIITEFGGKKVTNSQELQDAVSDTPIGSVAKAKILRDGKMTTKEVTITERPDPTGKSRIAGLHSIKGQKAPFSLGFAVTDPNAKTLKDFDLPLETNHPIVTEVTPNSTSALNGLQIGDVILDVNRHEVDSSSDALKQLRKGSNTLRISRAGDVGVLVIEAK